MSVHCYVLYIHCTHGLAAINLNSKLLIGRRDHLLFVKASQASKISNGVLLQSFASASMPTETCTESIDHVRHECACASIHQLPNDNKHMTKNCSCRRSALAINLCTTRSSIARRVHEVGCTDVAGEQSMTCASRESVPCCQYKRETGR